eukprot:6808536-Prymnesium_polylepis.1
MRRVRAHNLFGPSQLDPPALPLVPYRPPVRTVPFGRRTRRPTSWQAAGQIVCRGAHVTSGYWRKPELTKETLLNGWLLTGDLGALDARGELMLLGRLKDVIKSAGENVHAASVERILSAV